MPLTKLHHSIIINAPREKVWDCMLGDKTYREWTKAFSPPGGGSGWFVGEWTRGTKMKFIGLDDKGNEGGMLSLIKEVRKPEFVSIEHIGELVDGKEVTEGESADRWKGAHENYTFNEKDGGTEVVVEVDVVDEYKDYMNQSWPPALQSLKEICEAQ
jgi:hypothetical protein